MAIKDVVVSNLTAHIIFDDGSQRELTRAVARQFPLGNSHERSVHMEKGELKPVVYCKVLPHTLGKGYEDEGESTQWLYLVSHRRPREWAGLGATGPTLSRHTGQRYSREWRVGGPISGRSAGGASIGLSSYIATEIPTIDTFRADLL